MAGINDINNIEANATHKRMQPEARERIKSGGIDDQGFSESSPLRLFIYAPPKTYVAKFTQHMSLVE